MNHYKTEQETFWAGEFGSQYISRNKGDALVAANISLFSKILAKTQRIESVLELGANIGLNLQAIQALKPLAQLSAVEINAEAAQQLQKLGLDEVFVGSIAEFQPKKHYDFVFTKGVLIHINPDLLPQVYKLMYQTSSQYICVTEYYNPQPVAIGYRGHSDRLFKRDFCGELLDLYPELRLVDYGFVYHRDPNFPADDLTWFLLEKPSL